MVQKSHPSHEQGMEEQPKQSRHRECSGPKARLASCQMPSWLPAIHPEAGNNKLWLLPCLALQRGWVTHLQAERVVVVLGPGVAAIEHVQHHAAAAPHVHLGVTALPHHHLWGHVGLCARHVVPYNQPGENSLHAGKRTAPVPLGGGLRHNPSLFS